jgi:uncharacterized lipoprotein YmbA
MAMDSTQPGLVPKSARPAERGVHGLRRVATALAVVAAAVLAAGCASSPDRYYTLAEPVGTAAGSVATPAGVAGPAPASGLFIDVAPVAMPERLARPQLVVSRTGAPAAEVALLEQHRWTSSFESEMRDALAAGIATRLGAVDVTKGARLAGQPVWRVAVQLQRLDLIEGQRADAAFAWTVRRADAERGTACQWSGSEPASGGIEAVALGAQRLTGRVSAQIARHVQALQADPAAACPGA